MQLVPSTTMGTPVCAMEIGGRLPGVHSWISSATSASPASAPPAKVLVVTSPNPASRNQPLLMATMWGANTGSSPKPSASFEVSGFACATARPAIVPPAAAAVIPARNVLRFIFPPLLSVTRSTPHQASQPRTERRVAGEADHADQQHAEYRHAELAELARLHHEITHAAVGGDQLRGDQRAERQSESHAQARRDVGHRRGNR